MSSALDCLEAAAFFTVAGRHKRDTPLLLCRRHKLQGYANGKAVPGAAQRHGGRKLNMQVRPVRMLKRCSRSIELVSSVLRTTGRLLPAGLQLAGC